MTACLQSLGQKRHRRLLLLYSSDAERSHNPVITGQIADRPAHLGPANRSRRNAMNKPVVLITGALTGIGRATAIAFAKDGARVVVSGRRENEGKALEAELRGLGAEAAFIQADVRHDNEVRDLVDQTVSKFGRIDAAVN